MTKTEKLQSRSHADICRYEATKHMAAATESIRCGEDDNAIAHVIDALLQLGRASAFVAVAKGACDDDEGEAGR